MVVVNPVTVCHISFRQALSRNFKRLTRTNPNLGKDRGKDGGTRSKREMVRYQSFEQKVDFDHDILL